MTSFAVAIPHTPWEPARVSSMAQVRAALRVEEQPDVRAYREFTEREPNHVWSDRVFDWGPTAGATHLLQVQDDIELDTEVFWQTVRSLVDWHPDSVIGLQTHHPLAPRLFRNGHRTYTTADGLVGVGWIFPCWKLSGSFNVWRQTDLKPGSREKITEDSLINMWAICTGERIVHPLPSPIKHKTWMESMGGTGGTPNRDTTLTWRDTGGVPSYVWPLGPHLGRFFHSVHDLAVANSKSFTPEQHKASAADVCPNEWLATSVDCPRCHERIGLRAYQEHGKTKAWIGEVPSQ